MKKRNILIAIFIGTLALRLFLAFSIPNLTHDSYFHLRQVEQIKETGLPLYNDDLSYGGRELLFLPGFHYLAAFLSFVIPLGILAKILPNLLLSFLPIIIYLISKQISKTPTAPLFSAFIAGLLPILYSTNSFSPFSLFLPLVFLAIYAFMNIKKNLYIYLASFFLLSVTSSSTFLLIIGFGIYLLLSLMERKKIFLSEIEIILSSIFFFIWVQFLFFKDNFLENGISFIWQNIPAQIIQDYFPKVSIGEAILLVSVIPFITGVYVVYRSLFELKGSKLFLLISLTISTTILTWFRIIQFRLSLAFFGLILAILFASFLEDAKKFFSQTKASHLKKYASIALIILLGLSMGYPAVLAAINQETPSNGEIEAFQWLKENTPKNSGVLSLLEEGHLIVYYGKRRNIMDDKFVLIEDSEQRFTDLSSLFRSSFETLALEVLDKYKIKYLVLTTRAQEKYPEFKFLTKKCFKEIYNNQTRIYQVTCNLGISK